jgi:hypothetical protein
LPSGSTSLCIITSRLANSLRLSCPM